MNQTRNYYTNPRKNMPADSVASANPMTDGRAQNVSYERGRLFWVEMDTRLVTPDELVDSLAKAAGG